MTTIPVHNECNNNCIMCTNNPEKLKTFQECQIIKKIHELKSKENEIINVTLSGGEPTLNKNFFNVLKLVRKKFPEKGITILSNGRLFAYEDYTREFVKLKIDGLKIAIPIHGHMAKLHDYITQTNGSFDQTLRGIKNLLRYSIPIEIRVVINRANYKHLPEIAEFISHIGKILYASFIAMEIEGKGLYNKDKIIVKYKEFSPFLDTAIHIMENNEKDLRLYHFPLCTIKQHNWKYMWKTLPDEELQFLPVCNKCAYKKLCMGIHKSYVKNVETSEFSPITDKIIIEENKNKQNPIKRTFDIEEFGIKSYYDEKLKEFSSSLPDIIAVINGIKETTRLSCKRIDDYKFLKKAIENKGLFLNRSNYKILENFDSKMNINDPRNGLVPLNDKRKGTIYLYLSRERTISKKAKSIDPEMSAKNDKQTIQKIIEFGRMLSYPECCIKKFTSSISDEGISQDLKKTFLQNREISLHLNNMLHGVSNYYLSFHYPCSFSCSKSLKYNKKILRSIKEHDLDFYYKIKYYLSSPILVWFDCKRRWPRFFDNRSLILFGGGVVTNNDTVKYKTFSIAETQYFSKRAIPIDYLNNFLSENYLLSEKPGNLKELKFVGNFKRGPGLFNFTS